jgi:5-carboxymethyl-2-hydroxymuconate isomerase
VPHLSFEYSSNLDTLTDIGALCAVLREAALATKLFPLAGIRVRALRCDHYAIADLHPDNAFIDISVRLREGRAEDAKQAAAQAIFDAAAAHLADLTARHPVALSLEMRDISATLAPKLNTIRDHMKERDA